MHYLLFTLLKGCIRGINLRQDIMHVQVSSSQITNLLRFLRDSRFFQYKLLLDVWSVDFPARFVNYRFQINYNLLSVFYAHRFFLRAFLASPFAVETASILYSSAIWLEREVWDMMGIFFNSHSDLRRILTDYGFVGFPLRKDFPLSGYTEIRYDDTVRRIITEPLLLSQEFRLFEFTSPWDSWLLNMQLNR